MSKPATPSSSNAKPTAVVTSTGDAPTTATTTAKASTQAETSVGYSGRTRSLYNAHITYNTHVLYNAADMTLNRLSDDQPTIATKSAKPATIGA